MCRSCCGVALKENALLEACPDHSEKERKDLEKSEARRKAKEGRKRAREKDSQKNVSQVGRVTVNDKNQVVVEMSVTAESIPCP